MKRSLKTKAEINLLVKKLLNQSYVLRELYGLDLTETLIYEEVEKFIPHVHHWTKKYLSKENYGMDL